MMQYVWLAFVILFVVAECATVGLVSVWFAGGSLVAMLLDLWTKMLSIFFLKML